MIRDVLAALETNPEWRLEVTVWVKSYLAGMAAVGAKRSFARPMSHIQGSANDRK
jgi:hypothetical protein